MTLSIAWVRSVGDTEELVFASDSRLRGGEAWDCCPKVMALPRSDCLISFAGDTWWAYPLILQMTKAVEFFPASMNRQTDIGVVKGHTLRVFRQMMDLIHDLPVGEQRQTPDSEFLFGGFSWREARFRIWRLHFDEEIDRYTFAPIKPWRGQEPGTQKVVAFAGDVANEAKTRLNDLLRERGKIAGGGLDMEPFEVLRDMIRSNEFPTVGGAPQVAKVYRFLRTQFFGVRWPDADGPIHALGRPALHYEVFDAPAIDPDKPWAQSMWRWKNDALANLETEDPSDLDPEDWR